jgi:hypothetical protein
MGETVTVRKGLPTIVGALSLTDEPIGTWDDSAANPSMCTNFARLSQST